MSLSVSGAYLRHEQFDAIIRGKQNEALEWDGWQKFKDSLIDLINCLFPFAKFETQQARDERIEGILRNLAPLRGEGGSVKYVNASEVWSIFEKLLVMVDTRHVQAKNFTFSFNIPNELTDLRQPLTWQIYYKNQPVSEFTFDKTVIDNAIRLQVIQQIYMRKEPIQNGRYPFADKLDTGKVGIAFTEEAKSEFNQQIEYLSGVESKIKESKSARSSKFPEHSIVVQREHQDSVNNIKGKLSGYLSRGGKPLPQFLRKIVEDEKRELDGHIKIFALRHEKATGLHVDYSKQTEKMWAYDRQVKEMVENLLDTNAPYSDLVTAIDEAWCKHELNSTFWSDLPNDLLSNPTDKDVITAKKTSLDQECAAIYSVGDKLGKTLSDDQVSEVEKTIAELKDNEPIQQFLQKYWRADRMGVNKVKLSEQFAAIANKCAGRLENSKTLIGKMLEQPITQFRHPDSFKTELTANVRDASKLPAGVPTNRQKLIAESEILLDHYEGIKSIQSELEAYEQAFALGIFSASYEPNLEKIGADISSLSNEWSDFSNSVLQQSCIARFLKLVSDFVANTDAAVFTAPDKLSSMKAVVKGLVAANNQPETKAKIDETLALFSDLELTNKQLQGRAIDVQQDKRPTGTEDQRVMLTSSVTGKIKGLARKFWQKAGNRLTSQ